MSQYIKNGLRMISISLLSLIAVIATILVIPYTVIKKTKEPYKKITTTYLRLCLKIMGEE